jgi:hypothetical protein
MGSRQGQRCEAGGERVRAAEMTAAEIQAELLSCIPEPRKARARASVETEARELVRLMRRGVMTLRQVRDLVVMWPDQLAYLRKLTAKDVLRRATVEMMWRYREAVWSAVIRQRRREAQTGRTR